MTPSEHLGELKGIDPETYEALRNYPIYCSGEGALTVNLLESRNHVLVADALQGCIQRACERRGWFVIQTQTNGHSAKISNFDGGPITKVGDSPAEALLAAYIAAVKGETTR